MKILKLSVIAFFSMALLFSCSNDSDEALIDQESITSANLSVNRNNNQYDFKYKRGEFDEEKFLSLIELTEPGETYLTLQVDVENDVIFGKIKNREEIGYPLPTDDHIDTSLGYIGTGFGAIRYLLTLDGDPPCEVDGITIIPVGALFLVFDNC